MDAVFYHFSKRVNSTKVPGPEDSGTTFSIVYKMPTSKRTPTIRVNADTFTFNYCLLEGWYYFVDDIISVRANLWDVTLRKDVLGTYRAGILAQYAYVLYDSVGNREIVDNRLAINTSRTIAQNSAAFPSVSKAGMYILSCVGQNSSDSWRLPLGTTPSAIELAIVYSEAYNSVRESKPVSLADIPAAIVDSLSYVGEVITKAFSYLLSNGSAIDAIRACTFIPFRPIVTGSGGTIYLGNYNTGVSGIKITEPIVELDQISINIPWQVSDWRRNAPYTQVYLYIPFIGVVPLPSSQLTGAEAITIRSALNVISGDLSVNVLNGTQVLGSYGANVGMPVPIGSSNTVQKQVVNTITQTAATAAGAALGIGVGAAALSGVAQAAAGQIGGVPASVGGLSNGAAAGLSTNIICFTVLHDTTVSPASVGPSIGLPAFRRELIGSVSGYIQTHEFSISGIALREDYEEINNYLNGGAYIE